MTESSRGSERTWTFAEGPTTSVSRVVAGSPEDVWARVSDITLPTRTSPELQRVEWADGAERPAVGARFVGYNQRDDFAWSVTCEITECEPGRAFAWDALEDDGVEDPGAQSSWRFDLESVDEGTRVTQSVRLGPGRSGVTWAIKQAPEREAEVISRRLAQFEEAMAETLARLG